MATTAVVFYSWQSDRENSTNRGLIGRALEDAAKAIALDDSIAIEPRVDSDTTGIAGSPDIAATIFEKIDSAHVFVADVTFVNDTGRLCPNPNVSVELGYAARALGWNRVVMVFNEAHGSVEGLPFDLRRRRVERYSASPGTDQEESRRTARKTLTSRLEHALRISLAESVKASAPNRTEDALRAIDEQRTDRVSKARQAASWIYGRLSQLAPNLHTGLVEADKFAETLSKTEPVVAEFALLARKVAEHGDGDCARALFSAVELATQGLVLERGYTGDVYAHGFDYWRFITLELQLVLIAAVLAEDRMEIAGELLSLPCIIVENGVHRDVPLRERSSYIFRLKVLAPKALSPTGEFLAERYKTGLISQVITFEMLTAADLFILYFAGVEDGPIGRESAWTPTTLPQLTSLPSFLVNSVSARQAERLASALRLSVPHFRARVAEIPRAVGRVFGGELGFRSMPHQFLSWREDSVGSTP